MQTGSPLQHDNSIAANIAKANSGCNVYASPDLVRSIRWFNSDKKRISFESLKGDQDFVFRQETHLDKLEITRINHYSSQSV